MKHLKSLLVICILVSVASPAQAFRRLQYDLEKNSGDLVGPYVKYNFLEAPYSIGLAAFKKSMISLELSEDGQQISARWPAQFLKNGRITFYGARNNRLDWYNFRNNELETRGAAHHFIFPKSVDALSSQFKGLHFCVEEKSDDVEVQLCSDKLHLVDGKFVPLRDSNKVVVLVNGQKVPTNAQVNLDKAHENVELHVKFLSGLKIHIKEKIYLLTPERLEIDLETRQLGIRDENFFSDTVEPTFLQKVGKLFVEKNYVLDSVKGLRQEKRPIVDTDMEFVALRAGRSLQVFALSLDSLPKNTKMVELSDGNPEATYSRTVTVDGINHGGGELVTSTGTIRSSKSNPKAFRWTFPATKKSGFNRGDLTYKKEGKEVHYFTKAYRGHQGSVAISGAISSGLKSVVGGARVEADYYLERFGIAAGMSQAFSKFEVTGLEGRDFSSYNWNVDALFRFTKGVRPVVSTFGAGLRLFQPSLQGEGLEALEPSMLGVGLFWHTAPQKIVDDVANVLPFFRYPKWMEMSFYYYPVSVNSDYTLGFAFSFHLKGRLMFSRNWFLNLALNLHGYEFEKTDYLGGTTGFAEGIVGVGYNF